MPLPSICFLAAFWAISSAVPIITNNDISSIACAFRPGTTHFEENSQLVADIANLTIGIHKVTWRTYIAGTVFPNIADTGRQDYHKPFHNFFVRSSGTIATVNLVSQIEGYYISANGVDIAVQRIWEMCKSGGPINIDTDRYTGFCYGGTPYLIGVAYLLNAAVIICSP
jgi:hypothetical protein